MFFFLGCLFSRALSLIALSRFSLSRFSLSLKLSLSLSTVKNSGRPKKKKKRKRRKKGFSLSLSTPKFKKKRQRKRKTGGGSGTDQRDPNRIGRGDKSVTGKGGRRTKRIPAERKKRRRRVFDFSSFFIKNMKEKKGEILLLLPRAAPASCLAPGCPAPASRPSPLASARRPFQQRPRHQRRRRPWRSPLSSRPC